MGPPTDGLMSYWRLTVFGARSPRSFTRWVKLSLCHPLVEPLTKMEPRNVFPPSLGTTLICTPPDAWSACAAPV